ncbi:MAG: hypothetical protein U0401_25100 [Anaerolineae bacterium]
MARVAGEVDRSKSTPKVSVEAGERVRIDYKVKATEVETARLTMGAKSVELSDGLAFELPIYHLSTPETVATVGILDEAGAGSKASRCLRSFDPTLGDLTLGDDPPWPPGCATA